MFCGTARASGVTRASAGVAMLCALLLAGCQTEQQDLAASVAPRGATVAFESIDGLPQQQFRNLVDNLNREAQSRHLAVLPRGQVSAYRVRGYFAAAVEKGSTTVSWVFDVFDRDAHRALRIAGSAPVSGRGWTAADAGLMQQVAQRSMDELAGFLVAAESPPAAGPRLALTESDPPEAGGIFRMAHAGALPGAPAAQPGR
jgi:hypothetical protein